VCRKDGGDIRRGVVFIAEIVPRQVRGQWCRLSAKTEGPSASPPLGSLEQFITEHDVSHVPWQVWATTDAGFEGGATTLYGRELATVLKQRPDCAFMAGGSPVIVHQGNSIL